MASYVFRPFSVQYWRTERFQELMELTFRRGETVASFVDRFLAKLLDNEIDWEGTVDSSYGFMKNVIFYKCLTLCNVVFLRLDSTCIDFQLVF
jgi:hypothetical protein